MLRECVGGWITLLSRALLSLLPRVLYGFQPERGQLRHQAPRHAHRETPEEKVKPASRARITV